jgi:hypothetical protein
MNRPVKGDQMTEFQTLAAMEAVMSAESRDTWRVADALLADVPACPQGGAHAAAARWSAHGDASRTRAHDASGVADRLRQIAAAAGEEDLTTPGGEPYSVASLSFLRSMAIAWPPDQRHAEAAFRTHKMAGGIDNRGRVVLAALCALARGEDAARPENVDQDAWEAACIRVREKGNRRRPSGFLVSAGDFGAALKRPTPSTQAEPPEVALLPRLERRHGNETTGIVHDKHRLLEAALADVEAYKSRLVAVELNDIDRFEMNNLIGNMRDVLDEIQLVVTTKVDDASLRRLIDGEDGWP